ncbi:chromosomal replication initiator protein DnaA [Corynebacterium guangdongense]|uniref:Chromosomal replication initiator protein DnaA n=1 Tax=Corynebacterium guangdongense TaxID=1783348 RepID=A0ABU2A0B5_9CORY|nr:chromosomal replication initiator protein DnaA [Corynebacterium guangdongense]MDR7330596.1 chromosomal replication initiator protein [Corynebacterium guangdongense]WJZ16613.1 Chromosomal replication initiator protein DnaA [Corynebacterium guangdongense]
MAQSTPDLEKAWGEVVAELLAESNRATSAVPTFNHQQRAYLQLVRPAVMIDTYTVLSAPHEHAKEVIEKELGEYITAAISRRTGHPCVLAVTVEAPQPEPEPTPTPPTAQPPARQYTPPTPPTAPPQRPQQTSLMDESSWSLSHTPDAAARPTAAPRSPAHPMDLDELAAQYASQQAAQQPEWPEQAPDPEHHPQRLPREKPAHDPNRETSLNPRYTFENFVIGSSNRFANGAAVAVAENPARAYNPLFIWGGSGLGKTHLLHATGNYAKVLQPGLRVKYVSSEEFTNDYINSVRDDRQESFKRRYRNLDILMVDDIQFLQGKEGTQEEFFHTFNALQQADKQIILSSDRPPKQLTTLEDRLRTRFEGGLITDVQPPDLETRIAILEKKAAADGTHVDRPVLELIASRFESSIRELEGALIRVSAYSSLTREPITMEIAEVALRDILPDDTVEITAASIKEVASEYFDISMDALIGTTKTRSVAHARQLAMYLCRELTDLSLPKIGQEFGGKDHTTVMYADRKIRKEITENRDTYDEIQSLTQLIKNRR